MIKLIREGSRKYPWILVFIMGAIVVAFVVGMGWWGYGDVVAGKVASVGDMTVTLDEYKRSYENVRRFYQDNDQQDVTPEQVKQRALENLIATKVWLAAANNLGVEVTPGELRADILRIQAFRTDGKFDPDRYRQILAANRLTPALFEALQREQLLVNKARTLVAQAVALTPSEKLEAQALGGRQPSESTSSGQTPSDLIVKTFLFQKQQRALTAYAESLKTRIPIEIYEENL